MELPGLLLFPLAAGTVRRRADVAISFITLPPRPGTKYC